MARRLKKFREDNATGPEVIDFNKLNFRPNFKFSRITIKFFLYSSSIVNMPASISITVSKIWASRMLVKNRYPLYSAPPLGPGEAVSFTQRQNPSWVTKSYRMMDLKEFR